MIIHNIIDYHGYQPMGCSGLCQLEKDNVEKSELSLGIPLLYDDDE